MKTLQTLASFALSVALWPARAAAHRRVLATLAGFDDRGLADIGLSRQDLRDATALPLAADPSDLLSERARERANATYRARRLAAE